MTAMQIITKLLLLLSGLGVFLFGMKTMGDNIESVAGNKLRKVFNKISNNRIFGLGVGLGATAIIQSSSATTVMVVGFVNAGIMTLVQATPIIMGANIGTTITAQIAALSAFEFFPISALLAALVCIGAFMMMSKKENLKLIGSILAGLGMIFVGLDVMSASMKAFSEIPAFRTIIQSTTNSFLLIFIGLAFTALIQSSSATTGILIALAGSGLINLEQAIFTILGINIGTCITAVLSCIGTNINAKRAAVIHLLFNVLGMLLFLPIVSFLPIAKMFEDMFSKTQTQIAMFHTFFNIVTTLVLLPFSNLLVKFVEKFIKEKHKSAVVTEEFAQNSVKYIDQRFLATPTIAIAQVQKEILFMAQLSKTNLDIAINTIINLDFVKMEQFKAREKQINHMNREISKYLVKISALDISFTDEKRVASYYHVISDLERIGDYAENITEYAQFLKDSNNSFSKEAELEVDDMYSAVNAVYENVIRAWENQDISLLKLINTYEEQVDNFKTTLDNAHIQRLKESKCSAENGAVF
ncbi:MAG: Na/Pi cotransporter family protein, partial [Clostridia bacterium]